MTILDLLPENRHEKCTPERLEKRLSELVSDIRDKGVRYHNGRLVVTGYAYHELYDWDMYFENLFLSYLGKAMEYRVEARAFHEIDLEDPGFLAGDDARGDAFF